MNSSASKTFVAPRRALLSVANKEALGGLVRAFVRNGVELVATGSTAEYVRSQGFPVQEVSEVTGFPELLGGRVKTLHPRIHAGILARGDSDSLETLSRHEIDAIDVVVVNLYPFTQSVLSGASTQDCVEQIDIGGPTLIRAAAKNYERVCTLTSPRQYQDFIEALDRGGTSLDERREWATRAFQLVAEYDIEIASWMTFGATSLDRVPEEVGAQPPDWFAGAYRRTEPLRYGENPHQQGARYALETTAASGATGLAGAALLGGKPLSYNNLQDAQAAWNAVGDFPNQTAAAIIKHTNPCGLAVAETSAQAYARALACDPKSAFGGVVAINAPVGAATAQLITQIFIEVVIAPDFSLEAKQILRSKKNLRILQIEPVRQQWAMKPIDGGSLLQSVDRPALEDEPAQWDLVAGPSAPKDTLADLEFAWRACQYAKSNAIVLAKNQATVGIGMGQVNRVDAAQLAIERANTLADGEQRSRGAVAASDAFFPFSDGLQLLARAGVTAVVAPGGSRNDGAVIEAAEDAGITLYFTKRRHFSH